jgi:hypothetical protein
MGNNPSESSPVSGKRPDLLGFLSLERGGQKSSAGLGVGLVSASPSSLEGQNHDTTLRLRRFLGTILFLLPLRIIILNLQYWTPVLALPVLLFSATDLFNDPGVEHGGLRARVSLLFTAMVKPQYQQNHVSPEIYENLYPVPWLADQVPLGDSGRFVVDCALGGTLLPYPNLGLAISFVNLMS